MDPKLAEKIKRLRKMDPCAVYEEASRRVDPTYAPDYSKGDQFWYRPSMSASNHEFRPGARDPNKPQPSCREDEDQSGNFDPEADDAAPSQLYAFLKRKRERPSPQEGDSGEATERKYRPWTWQNGRFNGLSLPIVLKLTSESGRQLLACGTNNWPDDDDELSPITYEARWLQSVNASDLSDERRLFERYMLRRRAQVVHDDLFEVEEDDYDLSKLTLGHPEARGCIPCLKLRIPCTILHEGATYPCQTCIEDGCDCELVIQPPIKRSCQGCRRRRFACSYLEPDSDHSQPCRTCSNIGAKCIAGPASGRTRTGPSLDQPTGSSLNSISKLARQRLTSRQYVSCKACRQDKKRCALRPDQNPPCNRCKAANTTCDFQPLKASTSKKKRPSQLPNNQAFSSTIFPSRTRLAQPILFNYEPLENSSDTSPPCHFCFDPLYGLLGIGPVNTLQKAQSNMPTRVCVCCTSERLQIIACEYHDLQPLANMNPDTFDHEKVTEYLISGYVYNGNMDWEWCSMCPTAASYACRHPAEDEHDRDGLLIRQPKGEEGCGLRLCDTCAYMLYQESHRDFETLVERKVMMGEREEGEFGVRADAELLLDHSAQGKLVRYLNEEM
ncbi:MAG: hypothetical protein Q9218_007250 [Villophora microphyllina]